MSFPHDFDKFSETKSGIKYAARIDSYQESHQRKSHVTSIVALLRWEDATRFRKDMLGYAYVEGNRLRWSLPETNPYENQQWCVQCDAVVAQGNPTYNPGYNNWPQFDEIHYRCVFSGDFPFEIKPDEEVTKEYERFTIKKPSFRGREQSFGDAGTIVAKNSKAVLGAGFRIDSEEQWVYTWLGVPVKALPTTAWRNLIGKVNDTTFDDFDPEKVLFAGVSDERYRDVTGQFVADVSYLLRIRVEGWNKLLDAMGVLRDAVYRPPDPLPSDYVDRPPYVRGELNDLFVVEP